MQALDATSDRRTRLRRPLYATLLIGYALMLMTSLPGNGPSEKGWIPIMGYTVEYAPLLVLLLQTLRPTRLIWWLIAIMCTLFGALTVLGLVRTGWIAGALYRLAILAWVSVVLYYDRPTAKPRADE